MKSEQAQPIDSSTLEKIKPIELPPLPENPLVSVLIANYNYAQYIGEAIEGVLNQTYQNFEIIVCDDGSTDNSLEVIERYAKLDKRVKYVAKENGGVASALNTAFAHSSGSVICLLDSDDKWFPHRLSRVVSKLLISKQSGLVVHPLRVVDHLGKTVLWQVPTFLKDGWFGQQIFDGYSPVLAPASGITLRREIAQRVFPLPETFRTGADRILLECAMLFTNVCSIKEPLGIYRVHGKNLTGVEGPTSSESLDRAIEKVRVVLDYRKQFIQNTLGLIPNYDISLAPAMVELICAKRLLIGERCHSENEKLISLLHDPKKRIAWRALFLLPTSLATRVLKIWWSSGFFKRLLQFILGHVQ